MKVKVVTLLVALAFASSAFSASRDADWKKVDDAISKGLPRTAITNLEMIITGALKDKAYGEAAKAIARKIVLEGNIQGNKAEEKITRMEAEIAGAPREIVPLLDTIQANWYWHYFQNNRWRFMQRTATAQEPGKDFTTWDLTRLFAEIDRQFTKSLAAADGLKKVPIAQFDELLVKGALPDAYRPTLYDFIAHEALKFYTSGEQAAAKPQDAFEISADSPMLGSPENFLAWQPDTTDTGSPGLKAIRLFQELLKFHQKDRDPSAFLDVDLARLAYGYNIAFGENKSARYQSALNTFVDKWADHELSAMALVQWARVIQQEGELVKARGTALRGANAFPNSPGGKPCRNLVTEIEAKSASLTTERVWNAPWPSLQVQYRNVTNVYFRAVAYDWNLFLQRNRSRPESPNESERAEILAKTPALAWSATLPPTPDFKERTEELPAPDSLKPGFYFIVASHDPSFGEADNQIVFTDVWVSDLALVVRPRNGAIEGFVLEANSGEPVPGAEIMAWHLDNHGNRLPNGPPGSTDENGFFKASSSPNSGTLIRARHNGRELASQQEYYAWEQHRNVAYDQTIFFTDRALYRPGQTIQFKGIAVHVDTEKDTYEVLAGRRLKIVFADPNGKEIEKAEPQCNDYGSFHGSFTTPRDRVMGRMRIYVTSGENGEAGFNVEEYKRPKFQVTLDAPKTAAKLNDTVSLIGKAESYTGAAIDNAPVKWRVVRQVRWPYWWGWYDSWRTPRAQGSQEIAHGVASTSTDGSFTIAFTAKPDPSVLEKDEASFTFSVFADVTDSSGETRSAQRGVNVGFTALTAVLTADEWQTDERTVELKLATTTLDGEGQAAEGTVKIFRLKEPAQVQRPALAGRYYWRGGDTAEPKKDLSDPNNWEPGDMAVQKGFTTDKEGRTKLEFNLGPGAYRAMLETQDRFGKKVTARLPLRVLQPGAEKFELKMPHLIAAPEWSREPGQEFTAVWGTGYDAGRAFIEIEHRGQMIERYWTRAGRTQQQIKHAVTEAMRGGFTLHVTQVRENRAFLESRRIEVPWSNKNFDLQWEHFTSKLQPGQKETWTLQISNSVPSLQDSGRFAAEMVATLYDESLDAYLGHGWQQRFGFFRMDYSSASGDFVNTAKSFQHLKGYWNNSYVSVDLRYREFPQDLVANFWGYGFGGRGKDGGVYSVNAVGFAQENAPAPAATALPMLAKARAERQDGYLADAVSGGELRTPGEPPPRPGATQGPDLGQVSARKNLNETAFFFPQLLSDANGVVKLEFTMPEALTQWKFMGFAHDRQCRSGFLRGKTVTAKDLMVQPNPPRFLREGDVLEFTVKVSNQTAARQEGRVRLTFNEAASETSADKLLGNSTPEIPFDIPAKESRSYSWRVRVPDGCPFLTYKAVGSTGKVSDGEEGYLPVLSRYIFLTESLPLPIRGVAGGPVTKKFEFTKLLKSGKSETQRHQGLTVQMVSNPSWYAVMALPYLMEYPYECTEQTFNRFYANALARNIANSDPKIHRVFEQWRGTPALDSPLEKNQDLKSVLIEETPWVRQANSESQARRNVGILFDDNRLTSESARTLSKLTELQLPDGSWPWFPGGRGNDYITLYITTGFGRLRHLGVDIPVEPAVRALDRLDAWMDEHYRDIQRWTHPEDYVPSSTDALYLYGRSFFLKDKQVAAAHDKAVSFFLAQSRRHWLKVDNRQSQGHLAIALRRFGASTQLNDTTPKDIMRSIKERSVTDEEMGMFWRETELSWWWYRAPIETQALMIEAFDEVMGDAAAVEECKVWLLKQKQTQDWKTTKATADAVYALLLRGRDFLASSQLVEVTVGGIKLTPGADQIAIRKSQIANPAEAGTGFYERKFAAADIKPGLGEITVKKTDQGVAWGSVHWQYLEDMSKVTPYEGTPLKLKKSLYTKTNTKKGQVLEPVKGALAVGDELVVRLELRVDRDMEYVHLKDQRGSGTEPVNVLSRYKYQDGLAYYESTRDTASHFFIDYLPKGVYVFEYSTRVQHRGDYQTGVAEIQCLYAPEFNSHSESLRLAVR